MAVNNETHAWEQKTIYLNGVPTAGITDINWTKKKEKKLTYGAGSRPLGSGHGNEDYSGDFTLTKAEADKFEALARAAGADARSYIPFTIVVAYKDKAADGQLVKYELSALRTETLENVEITDIGASDKQADTQLVRKYTFICGNIR